MIARPGPITASCGALLLAAVACTSRTPAPPRTTEQPARPTSASEWDDQRAYELADRFTFRDPRDLARRLHAAEDAIRAGTLSNEEVARQAHVQQAAYGRLIREEGWRAEVLAHMPNQFDRVVQDNVEAGANILELTVGGEDIPRWRIKKPEHSAETLVRFYKDAAEENRIGWEYLAAINLVETRMGRIVGTSPAGAKGPMQFMQETWDETFPEGEIHDPRDSIIAAARYLRRYGAPDDWNAALGQYINDDARYIRAIKKYAEVIRKNPNAYDGYYHWQVYVVTKKGLALLWEGYPRAPFEPSLYEVTQSRS